MSLEVKICGLSTSEAVAAAVGAGADYVGFVFFPPSPRCVTLELAAELAATVPEGVVKVGLSVDADDEALAAILKEVPLDLLQLHGRESPDRVRHVQARFGLPVMKAVPIASEADVLAARAWDGVADRLLFDARPPKDSVLPGGNAKVFDWTLLAGHEWRSPWMLAGGLDVDNIAAALAITHAPAIDVSSGVEDAPGVKSIAKIRTLLERARAL